METYVEIIRRSGPKSLERRREQTLQGIIGLQEGEKTPSSIESSRNGFDVCETRIRRHIS